MYRNCRLTARPPDVARRPIGRDKLKNMQWAEWYPPDPGSTPWAEVGFLAVCERAPDADWYVAILYHEIFLAPDLTPLRLPPWPLGGGKPGESD